MHTTTPPFVLALLGAIDAGKDTAARYLEEQYAFTAFGFADPGRDMLGALAEHVDVGGEWLTERALKEHPMPVLGRSYRDLARSLLTGWGREQVAVDLWVRIADHKARQALERGENVLLTDLRHVNEWRWLQRLGGQVVLVQRDGRAFDAAAHDSELQASSLCPDHTVTNNATTAHLYDQLDVLMGRLRTYGATNA